MEKEKKIFSALKESFDKTHEMELKVKALYDVFGKHFKEPNDSFNMDVDSSEDDGTISVRTITINEEKYAVLVEVDGFTLDDGMTQAVLLTKDNCVELIRALSTAASLLR